MGDVARVLLARFATRVRSYTELVNHQRSPRRKNDPSAQSCNRRKNIGALAVRDENSLIAA
jgi:hypothetical protein